jgi:UrcA family protein
MITRIVLPALALGLAMAAAPAAAAPAQVAVSYADLDLAKDEGRKVLDRRLARAERRVCGARPVRDLTLMQRHKACLAEARASYAPQVELALANANERRVAVLADKLGMLVGF